MSDIVAELAGTIATAAATHRPLVIRAGGSKDFYGGMPQGALLDVSGLRGIVSYEPTELVLTARAATPLVELEAALAEHGQMLPFEPPHFGPGATLGGCVAAGLSGPRRAYAGAVRDFVLGVRVLDGNGTELRFGGQVMKNVAGYDVARLMTGALGTLGVLLEISLKVLPAPPAETTLSIDCGQADAIARMNEWGGLPLPLSATAWFGDRLLVRLSGAPAAVDAGARRIGGQAIAGLAGRALWQGLREQTHHCLAGDKPLWRLSIKSTTPPLAGGAPLLIEWGGALRWVRTADEPARLQALAAAAGGHATLFRDGDRSMGPFHPLPEPLMRIHRRLKQTFDPAGILNRGRLHPAAG